MVQSLTVRFCIRTLQTVQSHNNALYCVCPASGIRLSARGPSSLQPAIVLSIGRSLLCKTAVRFVYWTLKHYTILYFVYNAQPCTRSFFFIFSILPVTVIILYCYRYISTTTRVGSPRFWFIRINDRWSIFFFFF